MNTDIAGLCERMRDRVALCKDCGGVSTYDEDDCALDTEAADTLERQAAEIERLRGALAFYADRKLYRGNDTSRWTAAGDAEGRSARAALTGED